MAKSKTATGVNKNGTQRGGPRPKLTDAKKAERREGQNRLVEDPFWDAQRGEWVHPTRGYACCGASRSPTGIRGPGICAAQKGAGTSHLGYGRCRSHGGNSPSGIAAAAREKVFKERPVLGTPLPIGPHEAILSEVQHTAGHVAWLRQMIQLMGETPNYKASVFDEDSDDEGNRYVDKRAGDPGRKGWDKTLTQVTPDLRISLSVWLEMYERERTHLVSVCKAAVSMGVAERAVRIAEDQGQLMATVIMNIFNDAALGLTYEQRLAFPDIARRHLEAADANLSPEKLDQSHVQNNPALPKSTTEPDIIDVESSEDDEEWEEF